MASTQTLTPPNLHSRTPPNLHSKTRPNLASKANLNLANRLLSKTSHPLPSQLSLLSSKVCGKPGEKVYSSCLMDGNRSVINTFPIGNLYSMTHVVYGSSANLLFCKSSFEISQCAGLKQQHLPLPHFQQLERADLHPMLIRGRGKELKLPKGSRTCRPLRRRRGALTTCSRLRDRTGEG